VIVDARLYRVPPPHAPTPFPYTTLFRSVVEHALLQQELRTLEALGEVLLDRLLDHARPGERDQGAGLGEDHVAQRREAGGDLRRSQEHTSELQSRENVVCRHPLVDKTSV